MIKFIVKGLTSLTIVSVVFAVRNALKPDALYVFSVKEATVLKAAETPALK
ncbi:MAG: hypothetical protein ACKO13_06250 [Cytophagales bacterium]